jgi:hypothetical protein
MPCVFCGGGDRWIKTCLTTDGSRIRVCDPCWEIRTTGLVIVPGDDVVTARCDLCGTYANPREFAEVRPGGRKEAYAGTCEACAEERLGGDDEEVA